MDKIPPAYFELVFEYFALFRNDTEDFRQPHLRRSVQHVYPLFVFLYVLLIVVGVASNVCVLGAIWRRRLHRDPTYYFVCNLAASDLVKCVVVLPCTLANLLIQNWIFGSFLCFCIPMMQHIPIHASMLTFVLIAVDRYRLVLYPMTSRVPRFLCVLGLWVLSVCVVLPFAIYIRYFDFEQIFGPQFEGTGLCAVNVADNMEEYIRGLFIALYVVPLASIGFLYVRVSAEIKCRENPLGGAAVLFEMSSCTDEGMSRSTVPSGSVTPCPSRGGVGGGSATWPLEDDANAKCDSTPPELNYENTAKTRDASTNFDAPVGACHLWTNRNNGPPTHQDLLAAVSSAGAGGVDDFIDDDGFDARKEKRTQKYLISMVTLFAMCLCPLEIMRLVKNIVTETYDNTGHFDMAYIIFVWIGFLPTCITPILFASWLMSRPAKDRLRGYFRFSNRGRGRRRSSAAVALHRTSSVGGRTNLNSRASMPMSNCSSGAPSGFFKQNGGGAGLTVSGGHSNEGYVPSSSNNASLHPGVHSGRGASHKSVSSTVAASNGTRRDHRRQSVT